MLNIGNIVRTYEKYARQLTTGVPTQSQTPHEVSTPRVHIIKFTGTGLCIVGPGGRMACAVVKPGMDVRALAQLLKSHVPEGNMYCIYSPNSPVPMKCSHSIDELVMHLQQVRTMPIVQY